MTPAVPGIDVQAAEWVVRLSAGPLSADEQTRLDAWLEADVRHRGALVRMQAASVHIGRVSALKPQDSALERRVYRPASGRSSLTRRGLLAAGIAGLAVTGAGGFSWFWRRRGKVYETDVGEIRRITLADQSSMFLDSASVAHVQFSQHRRDVELIRGQALFEVAKDRQRPFTVLTGGVSLRAVGTVFAVRAVGKDIAVTVTEGVVEVTNTGAPGSPQQVVADERAVMRESQGIEVQRMSEAQIERNLAWREGALSFDGEPLSDAVAEFNRYNVRKIAIDDPALAQQPVIGLFKASDAEGFAETVAIALGIVSASEGDTIHLRAREER